jgi:hypothetical protein
LILIALSIRTTLLSSLSGDVSNSTVLLGWIADDVPVLFFQCLNEGPEGASFESGLQGDLCLSAGAMQNNLFHPLQGSY